MKFRPCIDIHNGKVKQIVGGSLLDQGDQAVENFAADQEADYFANLYKKDGLKGGHVILLNPSTSEYYQTYQDGLQIGGGITAENAEEYMKAGASHVIVTSSVFKNGEIYWDNLQNLCDAVGKEHVVLDLSCRKKDEKYYIVTDRWQTFTNVELNTDILEKLSGYCDEFLVHGVDVEGKASGIEEELIKILEQAEIPVTYAGGIGSLDDLERIRKIGNGKIDFTIGSALDLFGGKIPYDVIKNYR